MLRTKLNLEKKLSQTMIQEESSLTNPHKAQPSFQTQKQAHGRQAGKEEHPLRNEKLQQTNRKKDPAEIVISYHW